MTLRRINGTMLCTVGLAIMMTARVGNGEPIGRFIDVKVVEGNDLEVGGVNSTPDTSVDGLSLFFRSDRPGGEGDSDLYVANRAMAGEPFGNAVNLGSAVNSAERDGQPNIFVDGLTLFFESTRPGGDGDRDLYQASRSGLGEPFANVTSLGPDVNSSDRDGGPSVSADGLALFFDSNRPGGNGDRDLYQATRSSVDEQFGNVTNLGTNVNTSSSDQGADISSDGLTLFFASTRPSPDTGSDLFVASRTTTDEEFGVAVNINDFGLGSNLNIPNERSPSISADWPDIGSTIYFSGFQAANDGSLYQATWVPEPSTLVLAPMGLLGLFVCARRRKLSLP